LRRVRKSKAIPTSNLALFPNLHKTRKARFMSSVSDVSTNDSGILVGLSTSIQTPSIERFTTTPSILVPLSRAIFPAFESPIRDCNRRSSMDRTSPRICDYLLQKTTFHCGCSRRHAFMFDFLAQSAVRCEAPFWSSLALRADNCWLWRGMVGSRPTRNGRLEAWRYSQARGCQGRARPFISRLFLVSRPVAAARLASPRQTPARR